LGEEQWQRGAVQWAGIGRQTACHSTLEPPSNLIGKDTVFQFICHMLTCKYIYL
jgi:hypothetical protein